MYNSPMNTGTLVSVTKPATEGGAPVAMDTTMRTPIYSRAGASTTLKLIGAAIMTPLKGTKTLVVL